MNWIRRVSLVQRVTIGFGCCAAVIGGIGGGGVWALQSRGAADAGTAVWALGTLTVVGCLFALVAAWAIRSSVRQTVEPTVQCVIRIAGGDLETKIESPGRDEISWLRAELNSMRKKLRTMVLDARETVVSVNTASEEIASGNMDLSTRTESQASALQHTASSMEQLANAVQSNARSTNEARNVVAQSSEVAARGERTMRDMIQRMGEINGSATKISEIIGVIDGIAFQTNILALNAAVEAARAGEHGRGFAVVASEVRGLAQRSSTAAREIKTLIEDSTHKVEAGSKLVDDAGHTMKEILDSVNRVSHLIADIADAGQSQSSGIEQVHQAIAQIDTMTQQNAALVEQLAAAAQSLKGQSTRLTESMGSFRVSA
ncbi:MAG TPA: methyl-accepting chemotaxis protein [Burkholderiaceae bacterium]|nr:methyl-accepting chemotaxis protein [Burkholderiaceae bacterium]